MKQVTNLLQSSDSFVNKSNEKRKKSVFYIEQKPEALKTLDNTVQKVAEGYGVDHVTSGVWNRKISQRGKWFSAKT